MIRRPPRSTLFPNTPLFRSGDFHHDNVLAARREPWLAIDPKGVVGEPAYDAGTLVREPPELLNAPHPSKVLARDRKSTRLNSSHANISYAVFCLKKKKDTSA